MTYSWLPESVAGHRVIRPDFRGHGAAARTPGAYRISDYVDDVIEVLRAEGPRVLVGHSLGGVAAWSVAQRAPELVRGAFLEDPPLYWGEPEGHASNGAIPHFRDLLARSRGTGRPPGVSEAEAAARSRRSPTVTRRPTDALAARAYALLHLDPEVLDTVIDGSLLADTDVVAPVDVPGLRAGRGLRAGVLRRQRGAARRRRIRACRSCASRAPGTAIHDERAFRDEYFARVEAFVASA